ncbi:hypothetical protein ABIE67_010076 [Streptomyces sp. V4I8]|uniref:chaplin n=1 Tax=Streptomyces sp. V4I8 TaxID=3156469 RepID=UPI003516F8D9
MLNQIWEKFVRKMKTAAALGVTSVSLILAGASGAAAADGPILSGNVLQAPVNIPVDVCGNTVSVVGLLIHPAPVTCPPNENVQLPLVPAPAAGDDVMPAPAGDGGLVPPVVVDDGGLVPPLVP